MANISNSSASQVGTNIQFVTLATSLTTVGGLTVSANLMLIITLLRFKSKHLKQSTRLFLIYKSLGHAVQGLGVMIRPYIPYHQCVYFGWVIRTALGTVVGGMLLLSVDSFITITKPYHHNFIMTPRMAKLSVILFSVFVITLQVISGLVPGPLPKALPICMQNNGQVNPWVLLIIMLSGAMTAFLAMGIQGYNIWTLSRRSKKPSPEVPLAIVTNAVVPVGNQPENKNTKIKVTRLDRLQRLLGVSVISIFICWTPSFTMICLRAIMDIYTTEMPVIALVQPYFTVLTLIDGVLQPCLVVALSREIRSEAKRLVPCMRCCDTNQNGAGNGGAINNGTCNAGVSMNMASHM